MLAEVTRQYAMFVQLKKPISEYTVRYVTFLWAEMPYYTKRIAIMPITSLQRLSIELGPPKDDGANITFLWGSGRCGSTLITKMVEAASPEHLVLSEPPILMDLFSFQQHMRPKQFSRLLESAIRLLVKPVPGYSKLFIKPIFFVLNIAQDVHAVLPKARMLYSYRTPLRTVWAHERAFGLTPYYGAMWCGLVTRDWGTASLILGFQRDVTIEPATARYLGRGFFDLCCIIWAENYRRYIEQAKKFYFPAIIYDRLLDNPYRFCSEILSFVGVDPSRVQAALNLLHDDSQDGSLFSQSVLKGLPVTPFTPALKVRLDGFCDMLNLPRLEFETGNRRKVPFASIAATAALSKPASSSQSAVENDYKFITEWTQTPYEILHAGSDAMCTAIEKPSSQPNGTSPAHKRPFMRPYYKPLPLQVIFSKD